jgi:recombination endonuclease VII
VKYDKERYANDPVYRAKVKAANKSWDKANKPKINARRQHRLATDPKYAEAVRDYWLQYKYGITLQEYTAMVARQDGVCALCRRKPVQSLCVDHCHDTQMLRLLLCHGCNLGFGKFGHNPVLLRAGADYLEIWRIIHARWGAAGKSLPENSPARKTRRQETCPPTSSPTKKPKPRD